jgi:hypothetical protein
MSMCEDNTMKPTKTYLKIGWKGDAGGKKEQ